MKSRYSILKKTNIYNIVKLLGSLKTGTSDSGEIYELWFFIEAEMIEILMSKSLAPKQLTPTGVRGGRMGGPLTLTEQLPG